MKDLRRREPYIKDIKIEHECVFNRFLSSEESRDFNESLLGNHVYCPRLVPRETMTSGRKELLRFLWTKDINLNEKFYMLDVNMCYSYIMKN